MMKMDYIDTYISLLYDEMDSRLTLNFLIKSVLKKKNLIKRGRKFHYFGIS